MEDGDDSDDPLSTLHVTMLRGTRARNDQQLVAPPDHDPLSPKGRQLLDSKESIPKKHNSRYWSKEECATLTALCSGMGRAQREQGSGFWTAVQAQLPGRTQAACWQKWSKLRGTSYKKSTTARHNKPRKWSPEELVKLEQLRPPPGKRINWAKLTSHFPGRTKSSCFNKFVSKFGYPHA